MNEDQWQGRDVIRQESSDPGIVRLAELLLNAGCSWNSRTEYELEGDAGLRGVASLSAAVHLFLPGTHRVARGS